MDGFTVDAICADGYKGTAAVAKCTTSNAPYALRGCTPVKCSEPSSEDKAPYDLTVVSTELPSFNIAAKCKNGMGTAKVRACWEHGQPYVLEGCPSLCVSPKKTSEDGYVVLLAISLHSLCHETS